MTMLWTVRCAEVGCWWCSQATIRVAVVVICEVGRLRIYLKIQRTGLDVKYRNLQWTEMVTAKENKEIGKAGSLREEKLQ